MRTGCLVPWVALAAIGLAPEIAAAQAPGGPKSNEFKFAERDKKVEGVEWKASAKAGLVTTTGNSRTTTFSGAGSISRKEKANRFSLEAGGAFARSRIFVGDDQNDDGVLDASELDRRSVTTANNWGAKARYDRFLTARGSAFVLATAGADQPAGKEFVAGGQIGYSRLLIKSDAQELSAELGYDFTYEALAAGGDPLNIHSVRLFGGYTATPREGVQVKSSLEVLLNVNRLDTVTGEIAPAEDTRINGRIEASAAVTEHVSFSAGFEARYDNAPAPLPPLAIPFAPGFIPLAEKLDTTTTVSLLVSFL